MPIASLNCLPITTTRLEVQHDLLCIKKLMTKRQLEILLWVTEGKSSWEISEILIISERTVKFHLANIYLKLNVTNRSQAVAKSFQFNLIDK